MQISEIGETRADDDMEIGSEDSYSAFMNLYPHDYPPDWSISPANNYLKPTSADIDVIDSSLLPENERRIALCLYPFSKEFFITTGFSKLQLPDDYQELTRVIVWHNRQRLKKGLSVLKPKEFVKFLFTEMSQDFSDLGIDIQDFLDDLIKVCHSENLAFDTYNNYIQNQTASSKIQLNKLQANSNTDNKIESEELHSSKNQTQVFTTSTIKSVPPTDKGQSADKLDHKNNQQIPAKNATSPAVITTKESIPLTPTNLLRKFVSADEDSCSKPSKFLDKPIILKNKEIRRHIHRYDLRISIKECKSEEEEQRLLQNLLEEFLDTMLSADSTIVVPPYYELDRSNESFKDLSKSFKIMDLESFAKIKRYFSRLGNRNPNTGFVYYSCIVAASHPHTTIMSQDSQILLESKLSLWPRSSGHENVGRIGWLLFSLQDMDVNRL
jgi:hypothetical protein